MFKSCSPAGGSSDQPTVRYICSMVGKKKQKTLRKFFSKGVESMKANKSHQASHIKQQTKSKNEGAQN